MAQILFVDDEPNIRELVCMALQSEGYDVDTAATMAEAQIKLEQHRYSMVIADWQLPDGDGTVIANWAQEMGAKTYVISGYLSQMPCEIIVEHDILMKPFDITEFVDIVHRYFPSGETNAQLPAE